MIDPLPPETLIFNCYRIVGLAGQGEFGLTYLARDQTRFNELCMVKEFTPFQQDPTILEILRQRFHQSAARLYDLQHLQLPHFRIMFAQENRLYLVRDYVVGKSYGAMLNDRRAESRVFSQAEVLQLLLRTLPVLTYLHRLGLIHQNLSPHSIVLRQQDEMPVLIDFGFVKQLVINLQLHPVLPDTLIGAVGYASLEQVNGGKLLPCSDLYSLGATAIALLTGREPGDLQGQWGRSPTWETQLDLYPEFARILKRLVHPNPEKRFAAAAQVERALAAIADLLLVSEAAYRQQQQVLQPAISSPANKGASPNQFQKQIQKQLQKQSQRILQERQPESSVDDEQSYHAAQAMGSGNVLLRQPRGKQSFQKSAKKKPPRRDVRASAILIGSVVLLGGAVSWRALSWMQKEPSKVAAPAAATSGATAQSTLAPPGQGESAESSSAPAMPTRESRESPEGSVAKPTVGKEAGDRRQQLGIPAQFLSDLTDEMFYAKHADLQGKKLGADQAGLQAEWTGLSNDLMTKLETLSPAVRSKLGSYQRADYDRWVAPGNGASLNGRELNVMVNNRFGDLFPDQKGKTLNPKTFGQVWYAIAEEELTKLKPQ